MDFNDLIEFHINTGVISELNIEFRCTAVVQICDE